MGDRKAIMVEKIINAVAQLVHDSEILPKMKYSEYISEKIQLDYTYLANVFSAEKGTTIQQFIIECKIEKVKELIKQGGLNLTEISYKLHYRSLGHLSNQFKKTAGMTPSQYKLLVKNEQLIAI